LSQLILIPLICSISNLNINLEYYPGLFDEIIVFCVLFFINKGKKYLPEPEYKFR